MANREKLIADAGLCPRNLRLVYEEGEAESLPLPGLAVGPHHLTGWQKLHYWKIEFH